MNGKQREPNYEYWLLSESPPARRWRENAPVKELATALVTYRRRQANGRQRAGRRRGGERRGKH